MVETKSVAKWALVLLTTLATPAWGQSDMVNNPVRDNLVDAANSYIFVFDSSKVSAREGVIVKCGVWEHDQAAFL